MNNQVLIDRELLEEIRKDWRVANSANILSRIEVLLQSPAPEGLEPTVVGTRYTLMTDAGRTIRLVRLSKKRLEGWGSEDLMTIAQHRAIVAGLAGKVPSVQITGHLDEIDAPTWEFINSEARKLGPQTGSIDTYNFSRPNGSQPNGGVTALWNGNKLHALAVTVRDARNRIVCVRLLVAPLPPSPKEGGL